jgi:hypothetical protein
LVGMQISINIIESNMEIHLKTKNRTVIWSSDTSGHIPKGM